MGQASDVSGGSAAVRSPPTGASVSAGAGASVVRVGVLSDVQFCRTPNVYSTWGRMRHFDKTIGKAENTLRRLRAMGATLMLNLGDSIDAHCRSAAAAIEALDEVNGALARGTDQFATPVYSVLGNHDCYYLPRREVCERMRIPYNAELDTCFYSVVQGRWRLIALDSYDVGVYGRDREHPRARAAEMLVSTRRHALPHASNLHLYNGALSAEQLAWLEAELSAADAAGQHALLFTHCPLHRDICADGAAYMINADEVMEVAHRHACVRACFAGHEHMGGYVHDEHGVHHLAIEAVLEANADMPSCGALVELHDDRIVVHGVGRVIDRTLTFASATGVAAAAGHRPGASAVANQSSGAPLRASA